MQQHHVVEALLDRVQVSELLVAPVAPVEGRPEHGHVGAEPLAGRARRLEGEVARRIVDDVDLGEELAQRARDPLQHAFDEAFLRKPGFARKLLYVVTIGFCARHPAGGRMRLIQKTGIRKVGHHIADSCRTESLPAGARQGTRPHRLARGDESLDNGGQDLPLTISYGLSSLHI